METIKSKTHCPTCGSHVKVVGSDEGTHYYVPVGYWSKYPGKRPAEYGRYEVYRKGADKQHYETWNGSGWAYNNNDITHFREIVKPSN